MARVVAHMRGQFVGYIALFVALGGVSYAALRLPAGSVGTQQLRNGAVTRPKLNGQLRASLTGVRGPTGPRGLQGLAGTPGAPGKDGAPGQAGPGAIPFDATLAVQDTTGVLDPPKTTLATSGPIIINAICEKAGTLWDAFLEVDSTAPYDGTSVSWEWPGDDGLTATPTTRAAQSDDITTDAVASASTTTIPAKDRWRGDLLVRILGPSARLYDVQGQAFITVAGGALSNSSCQFSGLVIPATS